MVLKIFDFGSAISACPIISESTTRCRGVSCLWQVLQKLLMITSLMICDGHSLCWGTTVLCACWENEWSVVVYIMRMVFSCLTLTYSGTIKCVIKPFPPFFSARCKKLLSLHSLLGEGSLLKLQVACGKSCGNDAQSKLLHSWARSSLGCLMSLKSGNSWQEY